MVSLHAFAPGKIILLGEHYVVYGAPGLACAIEPYNHLELSVSKAVFGRLDYETELGTLTVQPMAGSITDLSVQGPAALRPQAEVYRRVLTMAPKLASLSIQVRVRTVWPLKGVGNSASLAAALGAGLLSAIAPSQCKKPTLFALAQAADTVAHGGSPSGIDASAVSSGGAILYQKSFDPKKPAHLESVSIVIPVGWCFLLVDTLQPGEEKATTSEQIATFAAAHAISKKPAEMSAQERTDLCAPYNVLFARTQAALRKKDMPSLGACMDEAQELLFSGGVSTTAIDHAIYTAKLAGAAGAKLSGAGGAGGLVLVLTPTKKQAAIEAALRKQGFRCFEFKIAQKGAYVEK